MRVERTTFPGTDDSLLSARLDAPDGPAALAHSSRAASPAANVFAASRIAQALVEHGMAVVRFDLTGLGASKGEFANTTFFSNVADLSG